MQLEQARLSLDNPAGARALLESCRLRDPDRGARNLDAIIAALPPDGVHDLSPALGRLLPRCPDADMALNNLERFLAQPAGADQLPVLLENRARTLEILLQLFGVSQSFSDLLSANPDYLDMLRVPLSRSPSPAEMRASLQAEVDAAFEDSAVLRVFRRFRQRQLLRIGANDVIRDRPLEEITRDISRTADVALEVALATALAPSANASASPTLKPASPFPASSSRSANTAARNSITAATSI